MKIVYFKKKKIQVGKVKLVELHNYLCEQWQFNFRNSNERITPYLVVGDIIHFKLINLCPQPLP